MSIAKTMCWEPGVDEFPVWVRKTASEFAATEINMQDSSGKRPLLRNHHICRSGFKQTPVVFNLSLFLSQALSLFSLSLAANPYVQIYILDKNQYTKEIKIQPVWFFVEAVDPRGPSPSHPRVISGYCSAPWNPRFENHCSGLSSPHTEGIRIFSDLDSSAAPQTTLPHPPPNCFYASTHAKNFIGWDLLYFCLKSWKVSFDGKWV